MKKFSRVKWIQINLYSKGGFVRMHYHKNNLYIQKET